MAVLEQERHNGSAEIGGISSASSGRSSIWFNLWSLRNLNADWDTFDLAFLHEFQPDMRPILLEICWKEVEDWEIEWVEMRAKLLQQSQIDSETTKFEMEQETIAVSAEIQAKIEEDQEITTAKIQEGSNSRSQSQPLQQQGSTKVSDHAEFYHLDPYPNLIKDEHREEAKADFKSQLQPQINPKDELKCNKHKFIPTTDSDSTNLEAKLMATENAINDVEVNTIPKEEGEDTANDDDLSWVQSHNKDSRNGWVHKNDEVVVSVERRVEAICIAPTEVEGATQPPPEPPAPNSVAVVRAEAKSRREEGMTNAVPCGHSGAADDFVAEGNRRTLMAVVDGDATFSKDVQEKKKQKTKILEFESVGKKTRKL
ncbi:hypothetical protein PIB30_020935 [Stylosanthes scabra]|uniref:Uncharacterized protein n=1 Tax=Stylosanthes scabra TaxID=79078 RepID=A0ABU6Q9C6_9FABA|nr:hypothetical protein [Stylosanthes scabra]